mgnify:CR=1 FL=1
MTNLANEHMEHRPGVSRLDFNTPALQRKRRIRMLRDHLARWYISVGGLAVLGAITLIFFYLGQVVLPLLQGASLERQQEETPAWLAQTGKPLMLFVEEQNQVAMRLDERGQVQFFRVKDGTLLSSESLPLPEGVTVTALARDVPGSHQLALGLSNGQVLVVQHDYPISWPGGQKTVEPRLSWPFGQVPLTLDTQGRALDRLAFTFDEDTLLLAGSTGVELHAMTLSITRNMMTGEASQEQDVLQLPQLAGPVTRLLVDPRQRWLYAFDGEGSVNVIDLQRRLLNGHYRMSDSGSVTTASLLLGGTSLLVGDAAGNISQWFMVKAPDGSAALRLIRSFVLADSPVIQIIPEQRRKGFMALDATGHLGIFHATAHRTLRVEAVAEGRAMAALSPRADLLLLESNGQLQTFAVDNPHPEVSWSALWGKVWYENYDHPDYVWQSTSATTDFEPKLSLAPLAFGTLKAAFYAMLLAAPLAICAAIYTAYFMAPAMRRKVKPIIELMEALPTVILGFFAGLFLAPYVESNLPGIFSLLLLMPVSVLLAGWLWTRLPENLRLRVPDGWESALLMPVVVLVVFVSLGISGHLENWFFGGDMRLWLTREMGIPFDQRNALVVGLAMGFAVIPNIFSIAEDAIFSVPKSLTLGSLALGATPWQTLSRVVILTASPGIFSALMIGMGRAVGETMIVLMATGNTPIMDMNIFEGLRTLAANVAVEMPESEVGSTHYRVLFLSALVLLTFTFVMNTLAELIRQRLRGKYASL